MSIPIIFDGLSLVWLYCAAMIIVFIAFLINLSNDDISKIQFCYGILFGMIIMHLLLYFISIQLPLKDVPPEVSQQLLIYTDEQYQVIDSKDWKGEPYEIISWTVDEREQK